MFGAQPVSKRPSAPAHCFASATRETREKVFHAPEDAPKQRRAYNHRIPPPTDKAASEYSTAGKTLPLWTQLQLEQTDRTALRRRAQALQQLLGAENLPNLPHQPAGMIAWILDAQVALTAQTDRPQTLVDFGGGGTPSAEECGEPYFGNNTDKWIKNPAAIQKRVAAPLKPKAPPIPPTLEAAAAYMDAQNEHADNKHRNATSTIFQS